MGNMLFLASALIALVALGVSAIRFFRGPDTLDRVVAFDVITIISISLIAIIGFIMQRSVLIDVALVYALLSFLGVIIIAKYVERGL
ncbi:MAG: hypothetical protein JXK93_10465 [Sphaerochaetaceae bacterium]|nr:hypothetical protein [Sphaerochaetaceae bacterium]